MKVTPIGKNFNRHKVGEVFELPDKAARILIRIGKLSEATSVDISPRTGQPKRVYRRRDMQAES